MRNYDGLKNKLKLDLIATISFFPVEIRTECNEVTQNLEEIIDKNIYDYIKIIEHIQTVIAMYKFTLIGHTSEEELKEQRKIPDSRINLYVELKRFCEMLIEIYRILCDLDLLEIMIQKLKDKGKIETANFLADVLEKIDTDILNQGTDGKALNDLYTSLPMVSYELETFSTTDDLFRTTMIIINSIYFDLKTIYRKYE